VKAQLKISLQWMLLAPVAALAISFASHYCLEYFSPGKLSPGVVAIDALGLADVRRANAHACRQAAIGLLVLARRRADSGAVLADLGFVSEPVAGPDKKALR
jgi:hypothetical protein